MPPQVRVAEVIESPLLHVMTFTGTLSANYDAVIQPRVSGFLRSRHFISGMPVRKGELLFTLDDEPYASNLISAEAQLFSAKAQLLEARNLYERAVPLAQINAISRTQLEEYATRLSAAEAEVESAKQQVERARLDCSYTRIYSPINGIISSVKAHVGDYIGPATQFETLTTISNIDSVCVDIAIPMREYLRYAQRQKPTYENDSLLSAIELTLAGGERYPYQGIYSYTRKDVSDRMGSIVIVVNFPNPDYRLKVGEFARVKCGVGDSQKALFVPQSAVSQRQGVDAVWVLHGDNTVEFRKVTLGEVRDTLWQIENGLSLGDRVVTSGLQRLRNGMKVNADAIAANKK